MIGTEPREGVPVEEIKRDLYTRLTARPDTEVRLRLDQPPIRRILARVNDVPGYGWQAFSPVPLEQPVRASLSAADVTLLERVDTVAVDARTGTFSINGLAGFGRLVDGGDHGDTYNYSPPAADTVVDTPDEVSVRVAERGPVRARAVISARYSWPDRVEGRHGKRVGSRGRRHHDHGGAAGRRAAGPGAHQLRQSSSGPPAAGPSALTRAGHGRRGPSARSPSSSGARPQRGGRTSTGSRHSRPAASCPPAGSTVVHEGLLEYELVDIDRGRASSPPPVPWPSPCSARRGCCPGWA